MPNQEVMREWVSRLRSGDYTQGTGKLSYTDPGRNDMRRHCCLGVLCDIAVEQGVMRPPATITEQIGIVKFGHIEPRNALVNIYGDGDGATTMPPKRVYEWADIPAGLLADIAKAELNGHTLAHLNDGGKTFAEIADLIEENWIDLPEGTQVPDSPADIETEAPANA